MPLGDVSGKSERLGGLVDAEDRPHQLFCRAGLPYRKWEEQPRRRQLRGEIAEVLLVQRQHRAPVELVDDVAPGPGDGALRAELVPPALRPVAHPDCGAVQADRGHVSGYRLSVDDHPGLLETRPVPSEPPGDPDTGGGGGIDPAHQLPPVYVETLAEHEDRPEP